MTGLQLRGDIAWRLVDDEIVVFDAASSRYITIAGAGVTLWQSLVEPTSSSELVAVILDMYEVTEEQARRDVEGFLASLREQNLLSESVSA